MNAMRPPARTMFAKMWDEHVVANLDEVTDLVHIDRHLLHDLSGPFSMKALDDQGLACRSPDLTFAVPDHGVSTAPERRASGSGTT